MVGIYFFGIAIIPIIITLICRVIWPHKITWAETAGSIGIALLICAIIFFTGSYKSTSDVQLLNGEITGKKMEEVPCEHSYDCNCRTVTHTSGSGKDQTTYTTTECDTCYEHHGVFRTSQGTDFDWDILTNLGVRININRIDSRGEKEPPRWTKAEKGQPVVIPRTYENLVLAVPDTMFNFIQEQQATQFDPLIPPYPRAIFDYHYCDRVIAVGVKVKELKEWNLALANAMKIWGPKKQANVIILIVNTDDPKYMNYLEKKWLRGKMNDIIIVLGSKSYPSVDFVRILSWSDSEEFKVSLRLDLESFLLQYGILDMHGASMHNRIIELIDSNMKTYKRFDREQLEYLRREIKPPMWIIATTLLIAIFGSLGLNWFFYKTNTGNEKYSR